MGMTIYRSSAGSGKTYVLVRNYLTQVLTAGERFKEILAITFTNKATDEMKSRIIGELHRISSGIESPLSRELSQELSLDPAHLQKRAHEALSLILHDYSRFSVTTIDSF